MVVDRSYKISVFGDFSEIKPTPDNMSYFLSSFKDYSLVPSIFQEINIGSNQPIQRIALLSPDNKEQVTIATNRMDYQVINSLDIKFTQEQIAGFVSKIVTIFSDILGHFNKASSRLALNTESQIIDLSIAQLQDFMSKYSNPITIYNGTPLDEWNTRLMIKKEVSLGGKRELLNVISIISKVGLNKEENGQTMTSEGFSVDIDINTIPENNVPRFTGSDISYFSSVANDLWAMIIKEMG